MCYLNLCFEGTVKKCENYLSFACDPPVGVVLKNTVVGDINCLSETSEWYTVIGWYQCHWLLLSLAEGYNIFGC